MNNILTPPKQPAQQEAPMHRAAPAGANLTNARTGGMVAPRGYAEGTPSVPGPDNDARYLDPSANARGQLRLNSDGTLGGGYQPAVLSGQNWAGRSAPVPVVPAGQDAPTFQPLPAGRGFGAGGVGVADFHAANTFAPAPGPQVIAAPDPLAHMAGRGLPSVPLSVPHAQGMLDAALGAPAAPVTTSDATYPVDVYAHNPDTGVTSHKVYHVHRAPGDTSPAGTPDAQPMPYEEAPVGTPEHAVANPHAYSPEGFHAATQHLSLYQLGLMSQIAEQHARMRATTQRPNMIEDLLAAAPPAQRATLMKEYLGMTMMKEQLPPTDAHGNPIDEYGNPIN